MHINAQNYDPLDDKENHVHLSNSSSINRVADHSISAGSNGATSSAPSDVFPACSLSDSLKPCRGRDGIVVSNARDPCKRGGTGVSENPLPLLPSSKMPLQGGIGIADCSSNKLDYHTVRVKHYPRSLPPPLLMAHQYACAMKDDQKDGIHISCSVPDCFASCMNGSSNIVPDRGAGGVCAQSDCSLRGSELNKLIQWGRQVQNAPSALAHDSVKKAQGDQLQGGLSSAASPDQHIDFLAPSSANSKLNFKGFLLTTG